MVTPHMPFFEYVPQGVAESRLRRELDRVAARQRDLLRRRPDDVGLVDHDLGAVAAGHAKG